MDKKILLVLGAVLLTLLVTLQADAIPQTKFVSPIAQPYPAQLDGADKLFSSIVYGQAQTKVVKESFLKDDDKPFRKSAGEDLPSITLSIADAQASFYTEHGYYWHSRSPLQTIPESGHPISVNMYASHTNMPSWRDIGISLPEEMDVEIKVVSYRGPNGDGYIVIGQTIVDGEILRRSISFGPENNIGQWLDYCNQALAMIKKKIVTAIAAILVSVIYWRVAFITSAQAPLLDDNLIAYWKLDEGAGVRYDAHNDHDLLDVNSVGFYDGVIENSALFDYGHENYLARYGDEDLMIGPDQDFSISAWFKYEPEFNGLAIVAQKIYEFYIVYEYDTLYFDLYDGYSKILTLQGDLPVEGTWYNIVAMYDADTGTASLYINGSLETSGSTNDDVGGDAYEFDIGYTDSNTTYIDEVGFWKRTLTENEICALYNDGAGLAYPFTESVPSCGFNMPDAPEYPNDCLNSDYDLLDQDAWSITT